MSGKDGVTVVMGGHHRNYSPEDDVVQKIVVTTMAGTTVTYTGQVVHGDAMEDMMIVATDEGARVVIRPGNAVAVSVMDFNVYTGPAGFVPPF